MNLQKKIEQKAQEIQRIANDLAIMREEVKSKEILLYRSEWAINQLLELQNSKDTEKLNNAVDKAKNIKS